jgi:site-specific recombinase XerD
MAKRNAANTRIKREYFQYLKEAKRRNVASVDAVGHSLDRFEAATGHKDFRNFHKEQAVAFKRKLDGERAVRTGKPLSRATVHSALAALRSFFLWLAGQPGYKSRLTYADADYFNLAETDVRIAKAVRIKSFPTLEQMHHVLSAMPANTDIELRSRALVALALLTGAQDGALSSFKLKHVDLVQSRVDQDARDVRTKASKTFSTWFFPVGGDALAIVEDWCQHLRTVMLWSDDDPLFPATQMGLGANGAFAPVHLRRDGWSNAGPVRKIFQNAFAAAGLPYFNPDSFRDTLVPLGEQSCQTVEQFKAWSQNLGHDRVMTTLTSYDNVAQHRQAESIRGMGAAKAVSALDPATLAQVMAALRTMSGKGLA